MSKPSIRVLLTVPLLLSGCSTVVESARIEIAEDLSASGQVLLSTAFPKSEYTTLESVTGQFVEKANSCGATTRTYGSKERGRAYVQANASTKNRDELDALARCGAFGHAEPRIRVSVIDSLLWKSYQTQFSMRAGAFDLLGKNFPEQMNITVPGSIKEVSDTSNTLFYRRSVTTEGDNTVNVVIESKTLTPEEEASFKAKVCKGKVRNCELSESDLEALPNDLKYATVNLSIASRKPKYDLQTITTVFGLLFGSGVVLQLLTRAGRRKGDA